VSTMATRAVIKRYEPTVDSTASGPSARMLVHSAGEWCRWADVLALEAKVATLEAEVETMTYNWRHAL
jgi:hypothetical protein